MKPKREITLGEMQDECKTIDRQCQMCRFCSVCSWLKSTPPYGIDLADPPRFTEAQMALLKALLNNGIKKISRNDVITFDFTRNDVIGDGLFLGAVKLEVGETLDLAELLGKDGAE